MAPPTTVHATTVRTIAKDNADCESDSRCRYISSGSVRVVPCSDPAKVRVAPNSPRAREKVNAIPEVMAGADSGNVMLHKTRVREAPN